MTKLKKINPENQLLTDIAGLIEESKKHVAYTINTTLTLLYWKIGNRINIEVLQNKRAENGKGIVASLPRQLGETYRSGWDEKNNSSLSQHCGDFSEKVIASAVRRQLGWTQLKTIMYLKEIYRRFTVFTLNTFATITEYRRLQSRLKPEYYRIPCAFYYNTVDDCCRQP